MAYRLSQLRTLLSHIRSEQANILAALATDLKRHPTMSLLTEALHLIELTEYVIGNLSGWMKGEQREYPALFIPANAYVTYEPMGVALIMGSWNFPFDVTLGPLIFAIAAGNTAFVKPSELSPASSQVMQSICSALDQDCYRLVQGGPETAEALINLKWDVIFFTGSTEKGKLVAAAAARNLVRFEGELGGKNPTIVDKDADISNAALRIVQGRMLNLGQLCISPEYVMVHKSVAGKLEAALLATIRDFYGSDPSKSIDYGRMINTGHSQRVARLLESHGGEVLCGGNVDISQKYIAPTIIRNPNPRSALMNEEVFGPVLAIWQFEDITECIDYINSKERPLAVYYFGSVNKKKVLERTNSGTFVQNETAFQYTICDLPFGGVGGSGSGKYHGIEGFRCMSNAKSVFEKDTFNGFPISLRYPPHDGSKSAMLLKLKQTVSLTNGELKRGAMRLFLLLALIGAIYQGYVSRTVGGPVLGLVVLGAPQGLEWVVPCVLGILAYDCVKEGKVEGRQGDNWGVYISTVLAGLLVWRAVERFRQ